MCVTGTRGSFTHFLVYTISSLAEQTTPAFLTLAEAWTTKPEVFVVI